LQQRHVVLPRLLGVVLMVFSAMTQAEGLPSMISFSAGGDEAGSNDRYLDLDYAFVENSRLLVSTASNRSDSLNNPITTRSLLLGFRTDPLDPLSVGLDLENWGEKGSLEIDTLRVIMEVNSLSWQFSLRPQWRTLTFTTDCVAIIRPRCQPEVEVKSTGVAFDVSYYTDGPWSFSVGVVRHQYDKAVEALATDPRSQYVFSAATLNLSSGLEDRRDSVGVSYYSDAGDLWSASWLKSVSRVTGDASLIYTLRYSTGLSEQWRLRLRLGRQSLEDGSNPIGFASAGLAYRW